jgi:hypothetical protein
MGIPIQYPDYEPGSDCPTCTPPTGELWEPGKTPKKIYVTFFNLVACPYLGHVLPNGKSFVLTQYEGMPCRWNHIGSVWTVEFLAYHAPHDSSWLTLNLTLGDPAFDGVLPSCPFEYESFQNDIDSCSAYVVAKGGYGIVSWNSIPQDLCVDFGLTPGDSLMYELRQKSETEIVHKFCDRRDATNVKILKNL